ncbi:293_t:CDS:1, partial [Gigaspora rosea]
NLATSAFSSSEIIDEAKYYIALCYIHGKGVEQDRKFALDLAKDDYHDLNKYENAWNIFSELANDDEIKLEALSIMEYYYNKGYIKTNERHIFKIALELYSKDKYKKAYDIFFKLAANSKDKEIKFLSTCLEASYYITGYNRIEKNKNKAFELILKESSKF